MKRTLAFTILLAAAIVLPFSKNHRNAHPELNWPMAFEPSVTEENGEVQFVARGRGYTVALRPTEASFFLSDPNTGRTNSMRMRFAGAKSSPATTALDQLPTKANYF